jgi:hypothetical protein
MMRIERLSDGYLRMRHGAHPGRAGRKRGFVDGSKNSMTCASYRNGKSGHNRTKLKWTLESWSSAGLPGDDQPPSRG